MLPSRFSSDHSLYSFTPVEATLAPKVEATMVPKVKATLAPLVMPMTKKPSTKSDICENDSSTAFLYRRPQQLEDSQIQTLMEKGFTKGLAKSLNHMREVFALRYWIIDNSESMQLRDGTIPTTTNPSTSSTTTQSSGESSLAVKMVPCSRWEEIVECVDYHIQMADLIQAPTRFRLLNNPGSHIGPQQFSVAEKSSAKYNRKIMNPQQDVQKATSILKRVRPRGCTPLTRHVFEIGEEISKWTPELIRLGKKIVIIIATDGLPSDDQGYGGPDHNEEFVETLRWLEPLPVRVIIRLCTDEEHVVNFYNDLNTKLDLPLEVLSDFVKEAKEVNEYNPWLNYALPLHRLREMGYEDPVLDLLDEQPLTRAEICRFCLLLFGEDDEHPNKETGLIDHVNWRGFLSNVNQLLTNEMPQYDPITKKVLPWINVKKLSRIYGMRWRNSFYRNVNIGTYDPL